MNIQHYEAQNARIRVDYITDRGQYHASSWQTELEIIYLLNGSADMILDGRKVKLIQGEFIVIDAGHVYELHSRESFMQVRMHVDREFLAERAAAMEETPDGGKRMVSRRFRCIREELSAEQLEPYLAVCEQFKQLVPLYISQPDGYRLKTESVGLAILYDLVQYFSRPVCEEEMPAIPKEQKRVQDILSYIEEHYTEPVTLGEIAGQFGLSREYFSRFFHRNIGIPFYQHLSRVRIAHIYHDLMTTDTPVMELLDLHGFGNYKLFARMFRELYGMTPREIRKAWKGGPAENDSMDGTDQGKKERKDV